MLRIFAAVFALVWVFPAIAQVSRPGGGTPLASNSNESPEGSPAEWRAACGDNNVLAGLLRVDAHNTKQRMPYPATDVPGPSVYGRPVNAERMFRHLTPEIMTAVQGINLALMKSGVLEPTLRELVIVRIGYISPSIYEVHHHASLAVSLGVRKEKVTNMACIIPKGLNASEAAAIRLVDELVRRARPSDAALAAVRNHFSDSQVLELVTVIGNWMMAARLIETTGVGVDKFSLGDQGVPENLKNRQK